MQRAAGSAAQPPAEIPLSPADPVDRVAAPVIIAGELPATARTDRQIEIDDPERLPGLVVLERVARNNEHGEPPENRRRKLHRSF